MNTFNVKVQYDMIPIRHIAVECPKCKKMVCRMAYYK